MVAGCGRMMSLCLLGRRLHRLSVTGCQSYNTAAATRSLPASSFLPHLQSTIASTKKPTCLATRIRNRVAMENAILDNRVNLLKTEHVLTSLPTNRPIAHAEPAGLLGIGLNCMAVERDTVTVGDILPVFKYDCPKTPRSVADITVPESVRQIIPMDNPGVNDEIARESPGQDAPMKEAKEIFFWRRRKMKKHQRTRMRRDNYVALHKEKMDRKAKRDRIYAYKLSNIKKKGTDFDALDYVTKNVETARVGGYYINILKDWE